MRRAAALALSLYFGVSTGAIADICLCLPDDGDVRARVKRYFDTANLVFVGKVETEDHITTMRVVARGDDPIAVEIQRYSVLIETSWKGPQSQHVFLIRSPPNGCLLTDFRVGDSYLVYAEGPDDDGYYLPIGCETVPLDRAKEDIAVLETLSKSP